MNNENKTLRFSFVFIGLQYITAILIMAFYTVKYDAALEFLKNFLFYMLVFIVPILLIIRKRFRENPINYLQLSFNAKAIATALLIGAGMALIFLITNRFSIKSDKFDVPGIMMLTGTVLAGLFEEIAFRGLYLRTFQEQFGFVWANIVTACLFSALHFGQVLQQNYAQLAILFVMGLFLGYIYNKTKSLWVPIILHSTFNILIFLFR